MIFCQNPENPGSLTRSQPNAYITGFKHLSTEERQARLKKGLLPAHIMQLWLLEKDPRPIIISFFLFLHL